MIYFATKNVEQYSKSIDTTLFPDIEVVSVERGIELFYKHLGKKKVISVDLETNGLDAYKNDILLYGFGSKHIQVMFDWTADVSDIVKYIYRRKKVILGHNLKFDIKFLKTNTGVLLQKVYDTMLAEQRLWMKSGYSFGYADLIERYLKRVVLKTTRNEFIGANTDTFKVSPSHLYYLRTDLLDLFDIRKIQQQYIKKFRQSFLIYGIEFPLISIIADAELEGFTFDVESWLKRLVGEKEELFRVQCALDKEVRHLRDYVSTNELYKHIDPKVSLGGNKYNKERQHNPLYDIFKADGTTTEVNLFGEAASHRDITGVKKKVKANPSSIDYDSKKEIVYIFARLEQPMMTPTEDFVIPQLDSRGTLIGSINTFTIKEDFLQKYLLLKPNTIMKDFILLIIKHSKLQKSISTYGENFITKLNPITGKLHTIFRQCDADTGRFQSGGGKKENDKPNFQNIPAHIDYRKCFTVDKERYSIITADYSGAELIVMASHAQDFKLIELSKGDMHSYMATRCWKNIFGARAKKLLQLFTKSPSYKSNTALVGEYHENVNKYKTFEVTKENPPGFRKAFKGMTFGTIYGMYPKKAGATLNVIPDEGRIVIQTIKGELPRTFAMVEKASADAKTQGFVVLNSRTNARAWFPNLIRLIKGEITEDTHFRDISEDLSAARNIRIQGTQADFVKEASVVLANWFYKNRLDCKILSWVHDEFVVRVPKHLDGKSQAWIDFISTVPTFALQSPITGKHYDNATDIVKEIMEEVANRYLINVKIQVELEVNDTWIK